MAERVSVRPPMVWRHYLRELKEKLIQLESELKSAKGDEAASLRARSEKIRQDLNYLTA
jgi:hypothetical protein